MKILISSVQYAAAHGKQPRGRGGWAFHTDPNVDASSKEIFWFNGTWTDAWKAARAHFAQRNAQTGSTEWMVYVLS